MGEGGLLVVKVVASTVLVVCAVILVAVYLRRLQPAGGVASSLRLRARLPVAAGAELLLVQAAGRLYLVGYGAKGFEVIDNLGAEGAATLDAEGAQDAGLGHSEVLSQLLRLDNLRRRRSAEDR